MGVIMLSPAAQHQARQHVLLKQPEDHIRPIKINAQLLLRLEQDLKKLSGIRSIQHSQKIKRDILPHYLDYGMGCLGVEAHYDEILTYTVIWCFDIGNYESGLLLAEQAFKAAFKHPSGLKVCFSPSGFKRNLAEILGDVLASDVLQQEQPFLYESYLNSFFQLIVGHDLNDRISAKLHRAYALSITISQPQKALYQYQLAQRFQPRTTVKRLMQKLEQELQHEHKD